MIMKELKKRDSPVASQNERPNSDVKSNACNLTADNPAIIDPYAVLLKIKYDQIRMTQELMSRNQELIYRDQELIRVTQELSDKLFTIIEKCLISKE